jgi:hypothetical protein
VNDNWTQTFASLGEAKAAADGVGSDPQARQEISFFDTGEGWIRAGTPWSGCIGGLSVSVPLVTEPHRCLEISSARHVRQSEGRSAVSRPLYNRGESGGLSGNWPDVAAGQGTGVNPVDGVNHLAKVRVAGSNPVFRSKNSGPELGKRPIGSVPGLGFLPITAHHAVPGGDRLAAEVLRGRVHGAKSESAAVMN